MTFTNERGEVLDFDGEFGITKQAVSFTNVKSIKGDFSVNFRVDNNSVNRKVLNYDGPQMLNQVAFTRQSFTLMRNGNPFAKGFLVIQSDLGSELDCYFISGNSNWINLLNGLITELDYSGVTNVTNYETVLTPANVNSKLYSTSGIVFPFVDWCYNGNKGNVDYFIDELTDHRNDPAISYYEFYPCFYLHSLLSQIGLQKDLKFSGDLLNDRLFKSLVIPPYTGDIRRPRSNRVTAYGQNSTNTSVAYVTYSMTEGSDPDGCYANPTYTANKNCKLIITFDLLYASTTGGDILELAVIRNGAFVTTFLSLAANPALTNVGPSVIYVTAAAGDTVTIRSRTNIANPYTIRGNVKIDVAELITANDYIKPDQFLPALSCLDIVKFCVSNFGCVVSYNQYSKTISMTPIESIKEEDAQDWSEYIDVDSIKINYSIDAAANNYQRLRKSGETDIKAYNNANVVKFGEGNLQTEADNKDAADILSSPFSATMIQQGKNGNWMANIPLIQMVDAGDPIPYTSISADGTRAAFTIVTDNTFTAGQVFRIVDDISGNLGIFRLESYFSATQIEFSNLLYTQTGTGRIYPQEITFNEVGPKILSVNTEKPATDVMASFTAFQIDSIGNISYLSTAHFTKPAAIGLNLDTNKNNLAFDNPDIDGYTNPTINQRYFPRINRMIANPSVGAKFNLPESVFQGFDFQQFIYLKTAKLTGYFFVDKITNYVDSNSPVDVTLLML